MTGQGCQEREHSKNRSTVPSSSVSKLPRMLFSPSLYIWTPTAKNSNPTRRNRHVSPSSQSSDSANERICSTTSQKTSTKKWQDSKFPVWQLRCPDSPPTLGSSPWHGAERNWKRYHQTSQNVTPTDWTEEEEEEEESLDWARGTWCAHPVSILIKLRGDCEGFAATTVNETRGAVAAKTRLDSCLAVTYISHRRSGF